MKHMVLGSLAVAIAVGLASAGTCNASTLIWANIDPPPPPPKLDLGIDLKVTPILDPSAPGADIRLQLGEALTTDPQASLRAEYDFRLGATLTLDGLIDGRQPLVDFDPYTSGRLGVAFSPYDSPYWQLKGDLEYRAYLSELDRSYAALRVGVGDRDSILELFYELRYNVNDHDFVDRTEVSLFGICTKIEFLVVSADAGAPTRYSCGFDSGAVAVVSAPIPLPAPMGLLIAGIGALGLARLSVGRRRPV